MRNPVVSIAISCKFVYNSIIIKATPHPDCVGVAARKNACMEVGGMLQ
jgi:hypothetical protein